MKKFFALILALTMVFALAACGQAKPAEEAAPAEEATVDFTKGEGVMSYADYAAAAMDSEVTVETFVQAKQGWWEKDGVGVATFYTQDNEGGYFLYNMPCTQEEYDQLVQGTKIKVTGYKSEWSGEVEIVDATFEIEEGSYVAPAVDLTAVLGNEEELIKSQNMFFTAKGLTVVAKNDEGAAFLYNWDGSGSQGDDLYFALSDGTNEYSFTVESYLCGADSDVYKAVEALQVGQTVDVEGFLYWYEGMNPHTTSVVVK